MFFTFFGWGSAGVRPGSGVFVTLHAAGAAPAAPAPSAGPHAAWRAAWVRAGLTNSATASLCRALSSDSSRTQTCWILTRPMKLKSSAEVAKRRELWPDAHHSVWGCSQHFVQALVLLTWCHCSSGSCCGFRWYCGPPFSNQQVLSLSLASLPRCAQEDYSSNQTETKIEHLTFLAL